MCFRDDALAGRHILISGGCGAIGVLGALCALEAGRHPAPVRRAEADPELDARPASG